jgi:hypothetical protein
MMAFAALHRAQTQDRIYIQAELRYQWAAALLFEDNKAHDHLDVTISTVWFLLQYDLILANGVVRFCNLLAHLAHILDVSATLHRMHPVNLSKLGTRSLVWNTAYDTRALSSGGRGGHFLRSIQRFMPLREQIGEPALTFTDGSLAPLSIVIPPLSSLDHAAILRLRLRCNILHGKILMLSALDRGSSENESTDIDDYFTDRDDICSSLIKHHEIFNRRTNDGVLGFPCKLQLEK